MTSTNKLTPPTAQKYDYVVTRHGVKTNDPYHWMRDENWQAIVEGDISFKNPAVKDYIDAENAYTKSYMEDTKDLQKEIYDEILGRIDENYESYPVQHGDFFYFYKEKEGKNYPLYCRFPVPENLPLGARPEKISSLQSSAEIYFDVNAYAKGHDLYSLRLLNENEKGTLAAYMYNLSGSLACTLKFKDLKDKKDLDWKMENLTGSGIWEGSETYFAFERDEEARGKYLHRIDIKNSKNETDITSQLVFEKPEKYKNYYASIYQTTDEEYKIIHFSSGSSSALYIAPKKSDSFSFFGEFKNDVEVSIEHRQGLFYILSNIEHENFEVFTTKTGEYSSSSWQKLLPADSSKTVEDISVYNDYLVVERANNETALTDLGILQLSDHSGNESYAPKLHKIEMPDPVYSLSVSGCWHHSSTKIDVSYNTPISGKQIFSLDLTTQKLEKLYERPTPNFSPENYHVSREYAPAKDGAMVPVTIISAKDHPKDGSSPLFVYGYGSYGYSLPTDYRPSYMSLIDRGFVVALAHIRGGADKGHQWYLDGKMMKKKNTFTDFIDTVHYLCSEGYGKQGQVAINGGSAGGLLMGAVTNLAPSLFKVVVADVAFVDVINTICDETLPLTPPEWEEWGNPITSMEAFKYMLSYSPYDNIIKTAYPAMLYNSGISDEQVTYWEPTKMVAKLRAHHTGNAPILLNMKMHAGHAGASKKYEAIEETAFNQAFILKQFKS